MKKRRNILLTLLGFMITFFCIPQVKANTINEIDMDIYINSNGDATIVEIWDIYLTEGTEGYRGFKDLGNSNISNFSVSDETGKQYQNIENWDPNASFEQKSYKNGFNYVPDGVELCWGISEYGSKIYTLKYNISNFVTQYTDTQGIDFNLLDLNQPVNNVKITIRSEHKFSLDNARIWAFGNNGTINFENGNIVLNSNGTLSSSQYMVALVRFETKLFNITTTTNQSFDDAYDAAMSDVSEDEFSATNNDVNFFQVLFFSILGTILIVALNPIIWIVVIYLYLLKRKGSNWIWGYGKKNGYLDFGLYGKLLPSDEKINYWREIPCNKDLNRAYWVAYHYQVVPHSTLKEGIIGATLLKWIRDEKITVLKTKKGLFNFKDNNYAIDLRNMISGDNQIENELFKILKSSAGINGILEAKEFQKWCKKNYKTVERWFETFITNEQLELERQGLIIDVQEETQGMFGKMKTIISKKVTPQLREDALHLKGLKKFLLDFSMMPEREYFQVHIWEEYLIFAQLLGIADKVEEQFSKIYPSFSQKSKLKLDTTTILIRNIAESGYSGVTAGHQKAAARRSYSHDYSGSSRSSGGGGSSYSSGGSSSRGSSGGGFR